jgi:hypothetical protein
LDLLGPTPATNISPTDLPEATAETDIQPVKRGRGRPRKHPIVSAHLTEGPPADISVFLQGHFLLDEQYAGSRQSEICGLIEKGVFEVAHDVPKDIRIFNARFVDEIKNKGTEKAYEKSRLVVQAYNDNGKRAVLTQSPTIQRVSQRIILSIAAMGGDVQLYLRDISQAYVQSTTDQCRLTHLTQSAYHDITCRATRYR